jgi:anti-sigma factor RsiW
MFKLLRKKKQGCEQVRELLSAYIDGQLTPSEKGPVEEHLASCQPCQEQLSTLRGTKDILKRLPFVMPSRSFTIAAYQRAPRPVAFGVLRLATAVAAFLLLLIGAGDLWHLYPTVPTLAPTTVMQPAPATPPASPVPELATTTPATGQLAKLAETPTPMKAAPRELDTDIRPAGPEAPPVQVSPPAPAAPPGTSVIVSAPESAGPAQSPAGEQITAPAPPTEVQAEYVWPIRLIESGLLITVFLLLALTLITGKRVHLRVKRRE